MKKIAVLAAVLSTMILLVGCGSKISGPETPSFPAGWPQSLPAVDSLFTLDLNKIDDTASFHNTWFARSAGRLDRLDLSIFVRDTNANGGLTDLTVCRRHGNIYSPASSDIYDTLYEEKSLSGVGIEVRYKYALGGSKRVNFQILLIRGRFETMYLTPSFRGAFFEGKLIDSTGIDAVNICFRENQRDDQWPLIILRGNYPALRSAGGVCKYRIYDPESEQIVNYGELPL